MAIIFEIISDGASQGWGITSLGNRIAISQKWVATTNAVLDEVTLVIGKNNSPTDNVNLNIYSGGSNPENGTLISGPTSVVGSSFPVSPAVISTSFTLSSPLSITNGTTYWFTFTRDVTTDDGNNYAVALDSNSGLTNPGNGWIKGWGEFSPEAGLAIQLIGNTTTILARPIYFK